MSNFVTLEEAAKKLGVSTNELIEMRSIRRIAEAIEQAQTGGVTCGSV